MTARAAANLGAFACASIALAVSLCFETLADPMRKVKVLVLACVLFVTALLLARAGRLARDERQLGSSERRTAFGVTLQCVGFGVIVIGGLAWSIAVEFVDESPLTNGLVASGMLVAVLLIAGGRRLARTSPPGSCVACGYDLRGSSRQCPECGHGID